MQSLNAENHYVFYFIHNYFKLNGGLTDANKAFVANRLQQIATWLYDISMGTHFDYEQKRNIAIWSVKYLMENPDVTWEDFKNRFLTSQCDKIKAKFTDTNFKAKVTAIDKPEIFNLDHETGFAAKYTSPTSPALDADYTPTGLSNNGHSMKFPAGTQHFGFIHSHVNFIDGDPTIKIFSPGDVGTFLTACLMNAKAHGSISDAFAMVITSQGNYMLQYTKADDNFPLTIKMVENWNAWYDQNYQDLADDDKLTQPNVEKLFMKFVTEVVNVNGLEVYNIEKVTGKASKMNNDGTKTACP